jgi:formate-dependent nitrite reductase cytochrome c552 subunit
MAVSHRRFLVAEDDKIPPPLCVWCSAPWCDEMVKAQADVEVEDGYYQGEYYVRSADIVLDITCSTCKRLVYRKEIRAVPADRKY